MDRHGAVQRIRDKALELGYNGVISIVDQNQIILSEGFGYANFEHDIKIHRDTPMRIASITKQFTAVAILQLMERGMLTLEDPVNQYIVDYPMGEKITIHHLLTHTSGIENFALDYDFYDVLNSRSVLEALIDLFKYKSLQFEPGSQFSYSISGFLILGHIIEQISGQSYEAYLSEHIFTPLKMQHSGFDHYRDIIKERAAPYDMLQGEIKHAAFVDMKIAGAGGGLYSSLSDLEKFNEAIKAGTLISDTAVTQMFSHQYKIVDDVYSGYGIFIHDCEHYGKVRVREYHAGGGNGVRAMNIYLPDDALKIIMVSNVNDQTTFKAMVETVEVNLLTE